MKTKLYQVRVKQGEGMVGGWFREKTIKRVLDAAKQMIHDGVYAIQKGRSIEFVHIPFNNEKEVRRYSDNLKMRGFKAYFNFDKNKKSALDEEYIDKIIEALRHN